MFLAHIQKNLEAIPVVAKAMEAIGIDSVFVLRNVAREIGYSQDNAISEVDKFLDGKFLKPSQAVEKQPTIFAKRFAEFLGLDPAVVYKNAEVKKRMSIKQKSTAGALEGAGVRNYRIKHGAGVTGRRPKL